MSYNKWLYAYANPINIADPSGMCSYCRKGSRVTVAGANDSLNIRAYPSTSAKILGTLKNGTQIVIDGGTVWQDGHFWRSANLKLLGGNRNDPDAPIWLANEFLLDTEPRFTPNASNGPLIFYDSPVDGPYRYIQGFGPTDTAYYFCVDPGTGCPYNATRGLHNGFDFGTFADGLEVRWTASTTGTVTAPLNDALPNVTIEAGGYSVIFGHMSDIWVVEGQEVVPGTILGLSGHSSNGDSHLHLGIVRPQQPLTDASIYYNPINFFNHSTRSSWYTEFGFTTEKEGCSPVKSFRLGGGNYWNGDRDYIEYYSSPGRLIRR
jgi:murein DD-endopeptidase MepM/ murein hydrolase activator NlpD